MQCVINASLSGATVTDADSFLGYLYIVSQYTVRLMTLCVWRILCLRNSSVVPYFRQPPNLPTAARRNRKCTECGTTAFGRNRMSAESAQLSTFGAESETEDDIRSTSTRFQGDAMHRWLILQSRNALTVVATHWHAVTRALCRSCTDL